jgi:hypothetical protein
MKRVACILICVTLWAQFDDVLLPVTPVLQATSLPGDEDEYLPAKRQAREQCPASRRLQLFSGVKPRAAVPHLRKDVSSPSKLTAHSSPSLYVFMSLQI